MSNHTIIVEETQQRQYNPAKGKGKMGEFNITKVTIKDSVPKDMKPQGIRERINKLKTIVKSQG